MLSKWPHYAKPIFALLILTITYLSLAPIDHPPGTNDKFNHFIAFFALSFWLDAAFPKRGFNLLKFIVLVDYGLLIELTQGTTSYRMFSFYDWIADIVGILLYVAAIPLLQSLPVINARWFHQGERQSIPTSES